MEAVGHVRPAAEEDYGVGVTGQGPQEHLDGGLALRTEDGYWLGSLLRQTLKSPSCPPPPAHSVIMQKLGEDTTALQRPNFSSSALLPPRTQQTLPGTRSAPGHRDSAARGPDSGSSWYDPGVQTGTTATLAWRAPASGTDHSALSGQEREPPSPGRSLAWQAFVTSPGLASSKGAC